EVDEANRYIRHIVSETNLGMLASAPLEPAQAVPLFSGHKGKKCLLLIGNSSDIHDISLWIDRMKVSDDYFLVYLSTQHFFKYELGKSHLFVDFRYFYAWP